ncbi:F-box protein At2g02240 [Elaeis guineensis]|uniref:F-box protein At2g02240 n=1 Tax=Elaeis guineensis var. tenera TaxID=51953 RepID=A0A6I9S2B8_ELAGV|nr:F-box protein At2g02240 [Elaeis guineensis]
MGTGCGDICTLPEGCISHVISLTSPVDSCRSAAVCTTFRSAAVSDTVWERFLPPDYRSILERAVRPVEYSSKKELFFRLCEPILIDDGKMSFSLEKSSGAKCYMLSARQMGIVWGDTPKYWRWHPLPDSRFSEVARLIDVCWLEFRGTIRSKALTPKTTYAAYLIFKLDQNSRGLGSPNQETIVRLGAHVSRRAVNVQPRGSGRHHFRNVMRADGWMEMEMGEFYNDEGEDGEVEMSFMGMQGGHWKSGLIIQGIEIRPKK